MMNHAPDPDDPDSFRQWHPKVDDDDSTCHSVTCELSNFPNQFDLDLRNIIESYSSHHKWVIDDEIPSLYQALFHNKICTHVARHYDTTFECCTFLHILFRSE